MAQSLFQSMGKSCDDATEVGYLMPINLTTLNRYCKVGEVAMVPALTTNMIISDFQHVHQSLNPLIHKCSSNPSQISRFCKKTYIQQYTYRQCISLRSIFMCKCYHFQTHYICHINSPQCISTFFPSCRQFLFPEL